MPCHTWAYVQHFLALKLHSPFSSRRKLQLGMQLVRYVLLRCWLGELYLDVQAGRKAELELLMSLVGKIVMNVLCWRLWLEIKF